MYRNLLEKNGIRYNVLLVLRCLLICLETRVSNGRQDQFVWETTLTEGDNLGLVLFEGIVQSTLTTCKSSVAGYTGCKWFYLTLTVIPLFFNKLMKHKP